MTGVSQIERLLGISEWGVWLLDQVSRANFTMHAGIDGYLEEQALRQALNSVQQRHPLVFGQKPLKAWLTVWPAFPPFFILGISGYKGTLTISTGTHSTGYQVVEEVLQEISNALPE